jgi:serine/threonine-protein kinase
VETSRVCPKCGARYGTEALYCPRDGAPLAEARHGSAEDPYRSLVVAGQFEIEELIGVGAMGRVYRAHQRGIERRVAIKILHRDLMQNRTVSARFQREARVASRLSHPNVVQLFMTGELERQGPEVGGETYLVMEYLDGMTLRSALAGGGGSLPLERALAVLLQVAEAVGEAHSQGVVHRDLKPENVMLIRRGEAADFVKVLDFGVARLDGSDGTLTTQAGSILGTAAYISPEGAQGEKATSASDVYSLAVVLFECLAGRTPFVGDSPVQILIQHTSTPAPDLRSQPRAANVPEPIAQLVAQNLAKEPARRAADARAFGRALLEAAIASGLRPQQWVSSFALLSSRPIEVTSAPARTAVLGPPSAAAPAPEPPAPGPPAPGPPAPGPPAPGPAAAASQAPAPSAAAASLRHSGSQEEQHGPPTSRLGSIAPPTLIEPAPAPSVPLASPESASPTNTGDAAPAIEATHSRAGFFAITFFVVGVMAAVFIAYQLGAFSGSGTSLETLRARAELALAARAWDAPPGDNVKDLTDRGLERWPGDPELVATRAEAARRLHREAATLGEAERSTALRLLGLALDLDPSNASVRKALAEVSQASAATPAAPASSPEARIPALLPPRATITRGPLGSSAAAASSASATPSASASTVSATPSAAPAGSTAGNPGGRWL